jgi:hypothetical protein
MTTWLKVKNNAASELASAITDVATELTLKTGEASRFPAGFPFHITIDDEILEVTAITDDTLTITRAQESTSAATHNAGAAVRLNITSALFEELQTEMDTKEPALPLTTKGDLLAFTTLLARLPVGSDGQYLVADSGEDAGIKWGDISGGSVLSSGTYTGNNTQNRAIPHGLGVTPRLVLIYTASTGSNTVYEYKIYSGCDYIYYAYYTAGGANPWLGATYSTTTKDSTNFYVGKSASYDYSANRSGTVYYWVAIG